MRLNIYRTVCSYQQRLATRNRDVFVFGRKPTTLAAGGKFVLFVSPSTVVVIAITCILFFLLDAHPWLIHLLEIWPHSRERLSCLIIYFMLIICTKICCVRIIIIIYFFLLSSSLISWLSILLTYRPCMTLLSLIIIIIIIIIVIIIIIIIKWVQQLKWNFSCWKTVRRGMGLSWVFFVQVAVCVNVCLTWSDFARNKFQVWKVASIVLVLLS